MNLPPESRAAFIVCAFSMLGKIAAADGVVSVSEIRRVEEYIDRELKLEPKLKAMALKTFRDAADSPLEIRDYAERFQRAYPDRVHHLDRMVQILFEVSVADGRFTQEEDELIRSAAILLGLSDPAYQRLKKQYTDSRLASLNVPKL